MLALNNVYAAARQSLCACLAVRGRDFGSLFSGRAHSLAVYSGDLAPLDELDIIETSSGEVRATTPIIAFEGLFLRCDSPSLALQERVFPLHDDESLLLARWAEVKAGECVLDIGTGAGITALRIAAQGAGKVIATDINPRAADYFRFNAELNGLSEKVEYVDSDVFANLNGDRFDVIVCNPPFVPVPEQAHYFTHSDGGPFGTAVLEKVASEWRYHTHPTGRLYALALSLGSRLTWRVSELFPDAELSAIYDSPYIALNSHVELFRSIPGFAEWQRSLAEAKYEQLGYFGVTAGGNVKASLSRLDIAIKHGRSSRFATQWSEQSWSMDARLGRYRHAFPLG